MRAFTLMLFLGSLGLAQDQRITIEATPTPITAPTCVDRKTQPIPQCDPFPSSAAPQLIKTALLADPAATKRSYMIHVATLDDKKTEFSKEAWYMYQEGVQHPSLLQWASDPFTNWFREKRIFGSAEMSLVYLYWVRGFDAREKASNQQCAIFNLAYEELRKSDGLIADAEKGDPNAVSVDKIAACVPAFTALRAGDENRRVRYLERRAATLADALVNRRLFGHDTKAVTEGFALVDKQSGSNLILPVKGPLKGFVTSDHANEMASSISYKIAISKKIPTPIANLRDIAGFVLGNSELKTIELTLPEVALAGGKDFQVNFLPSDMTVSSLASETTENGKEQKELSKNTWDNEQRYPIDFSLALPLVSYKESTVDVTNGNITAKEVKKEKLAAMVDFNPWWLIDRKAGFETKKIAMQLLPDIMVGIPIAGKPLQHPILAGGIGISKAHFFFGTQFNRKAVVALGANAGNADSATVTSGPAAVTQRWGTQFVWGLDFSVRTITDLLKKKP